MRTRCWTLYFVILFLFFSANLNAQFQAQNWRILQIENDTTISLEGILLPSTLSCKPKHLSHLVDDQDNRIVVRGLRPNTSLEIQYRVFEKPKLFYDANWRTIQTSPTLSPTKNPNQGKFALIKDSGLKYQGSFGRTVQVGNRQNLLLNSNFNLQLSGELGDGVKVVGAISDNTIPIQPEGDTRRLDEFDKVFIQVSKDAHRLTAGDHQINSPNGYFLQYLKKLSGLEYGYTDSLANGQLKSRAGFAAARGQFARNILEPVEGNQGPYQLNGEEGQRFLVILAGTERVWWDGQLLTRGADNDYIIDYNQGQIVFTYNRLVNQNIRIIVEFEYIDREYGRSITSANAVYSNRNTTAYINTYQHLDSRQPSGGFSLDSVARKILQNAGDNSDKARIPGAQAPTEDDFGNRILYKAVDTFYLVRGSKVDTTIYIFDPNPNESEALIVRFSPVGGGNGNYQLKTSANNGRVYEWVAPDPESGQPQGEYAPVIPLTTPESYRMITSGFATSWKRWSFEGEYALSQTDLNRLSSLDDSDNIGHAGMGQIAYTQPLSSNQSLTASIRQERVQRKLQVINPFRPAEFARDWSFNLNDDQNETYQAYSLDWKGTHHQLKISNDILERAQDYKGRKYNLQGKWSYKGYTLSSTSSTAQIQKEQQDIRFIRPHLKLEKSWKDIQNMSLGGHWFQEIQPIHILDSLQTESFRFDQWALWYRLPETNMWSGKLSVVQRTDYRPDRNELELTSQATDWKANVNLNPSSDFQLRLTTTLRDFEVYQPDLSSSPSRRTFLGRLDQSGNFWHKAIQVNTSYEVSSGQEPLQEFVFEERRPGEGSYIYEDLNNDGIRQVNEYIAAPFVDTARFVRIQLLNNRFVTTNNLRFTQNIRLSPESWKTSGTSKWWHRLLWTSLFKTDAKARQDIPYHPYENQISDDQIMTYSRIMQHNLFFNRGEPTYDFQAAWRVQNNRSNLISGLEGIEDDEVFVRMRFNSAKTTEWIWKTRYLTSTRTSQFFMERRYNLRGWNQEVTFNKTWNRMLRVISNASYFTQENVEIPDGESIEKWEVDLQVTYRRTRTFSLASTLSYASVKYDDLGNTVLNYIMLQEKRDGSNYRWSLSLDKMIFQNVLMKLQYDGRKNGDGRTLHTGQASFRANF